MNPIIPLFAFAMATWGSNGTEPAGTPAPLEEGGAYVQVQSESPAPGVRDNLLQLAEGGPYSRTPSVPASGQEAPPHIVDEGGSQ